MNDPNDSDAPFEVPTLVSRPIATSPRMARGTRPVIEPDNAAEHKVMMVSVAMLRELERDAFLRGFACSGAKFNGETAMAAPAVQRLLTTECDRQWHARRRGG